jgi:DNA-binding response OmpR family regulator
LMLTASGTVDDRVDGLSIGADDYLPKPFALAELIARIRALGRRTARALPPVLTAGDITLDPHRREASRRGEIINLTNKEFGVLEALLGADGGVLSAEQLLERVWDAHADPFTNTVRVTMANLRRKLGDPSVIDTVVGAGYRFLPS